MGSFLAQFCALCRKNWIILLRHKWINLLRCLILPIAYAAFFAKAQDFFTTRAVLGEGSVKPLLDLPSNLDGYKFLWTPPQAASSNATLSDEVDGLMARVFDGVNGNVIKVNTQQEIENACPTNFNLRSECFAAVSLNQVDFANQTLNYTMRGDFGLARVDTNDQTQDDVQTRLLPLQWAIESNFIELSTGSAPPAPLNWEYTNETQQERKEGDRLSYLRGIRSLIVLAHFLVFLGVVYQLPGSMASERASSLTAHLDAMGCRKSARIISWHLSISSAYFIAWVVVAIIFQRFIYQRTNAGLLIVLYVITGFNLASWTHLVAVPFAKAPTLAAITSTFLAIILAIIALLAPSGAGIQIIMTLIFPPMFYTFFTKGLSAWENVPTSPDILKRSPRGDAPILGLMIIAIITIFLFPLIATWLESKVYGVRPPDYISWFKRTILQKRYPDQKNLASDAAVEIDHIRKEYSTKLLGVLGRGKPVVAIEDLSFSIPRGEIFCLLGRNGAAKSTTLSAIAQLLSITSGQIRYAEDLHIGIASQKDVLWDELSCLQHVQLWRAIKNTPQHLQEETDLDLLGRCDLAPKVSFLSKNLSGGQKRKLQLACALAGGSNLLLLDEISSGLDPLSRRAIWKLITANRGKTTIVLTTHFLDEADYLGDSVAILQAPGKLLALDNPVGLKHRLGKGFSVAIEAGPNADNLIDSIRREVPGSNVRYHRDKISVSTGSSDINAVKRIIEQISRQSHHLTPISYQVNSSTLEDVFLDLNADDAKRAESENTLMVTVDEITPDANDTSDATPTESKDLADGVGEKDLEVARQSDDSSLDLTPGTKSAWRSIPADAWTIVRKRLIVLRRSWLLPLVAIVIVICATCIPLFFLGNRAQTCALETRERRINPLTYPRSYFPFAFPPLVIAPEDALGDYTAVFTGVIETVPDNTSFVDIFRANYTGLAFGGISLNPDVNGQSLFAWEGTALLNKGLSALNLMSNALLNRISGTTSNNLIDAFRINLNFQFLPSPSFLSTAQAMKWIAFFGLGVAVWPAFAVIYPTVERATNVRANQYSNGATPVSLWLGHLLFEMPAILLCSAVITALFFTLTSQFAGPGHLFICFVLYGIASTLYAYLFALFLNSPLAAWALVAGINVILFLLYLAAYLLILTYDRSSAAADHMTISHFTIAIINPVPNIVRAALVSVNLFGLLCDGLGNYSSSPYSAITKFGGPITYLVLQAIFAFSILVYVDSGSPIPAFLRRKHKHRSAASGAETEDVVDERKRVDQANSEELLVKRLKKKYNGAEAFAVDDVSFGVGSGETFALIGPNGAGKSTTLACIRGVEVPNAGDVQVIGNSIVKARNAARSYLGVCPQFNAIDTNLTVRQHLWVYGRLKGVPSGPLRRDIETLLAHAGLSHKADQLATSLSGGNQRKLSLAIALIGDRPVVLIDEFSSGVDPFSKREAWVALAALTKDRAVVMTTHSMEEVDALASRVGIIASKMLAVGTPASLKNRFATYEIHLPAEGVEPLVEILQNNGFDRAQASGDTSTRVSIPGVKEGDLMRLLGVMEAAKGEMGNIEMTLHEASTETAFLEIVRRHNVQEEEGRRVVQKTLIQRIKGIFGSTR